jgi:hypothetical protein
LGEHQLISTKCPKIRTLCAIIRHRYERFRHTCPGPFCSAIRYFLQAAGEPLGLHFERGAYGPYADATRHIIQALEGYYLTGYGDGTGNRAISLLPQAERAEEQLREMPETRHRLERVAELIEGFDSPYGLELLATTHWAASRDSAADADEATAVVGRWSPRKERLFTPEHVAIAWGRLEEGGWLEPSFEVVRV